MRLRTITESGYKQYNHDLYKITTHNNNDYYWFDGQVLEEYYDPEIFDKISELADSIDLDLRNIDLSIFVTRKRENNTSDDTVAALWYGNDEFHIAVDNNYQGIGIGSKLINLAMSDFSVLTMQVTNSWLYNLLQTTYGMVPVRKGEIGRMGSWLTNDPEWMTDEQLNAKPQTLHGDIG